VLRPDPERDLVARQPQCDAAASRIGVETPPRKLRDTLLDVEPG
jgi:hypothetical protein